MAYLSMPRAVVGSVVRSAVSPITGAGGLTLPQLGLVGRWTVANADTVKDSGGSAADYDEEVATFSPVTGTTDLAATGATLRSGFRDCIELSGTGSGLSASGVIGSEFTVLMVATRREYTSGAGVMGSGVSTLQCYQGGGGQSTVLGCRNGGSYDTVNVRAQGFELTQVFGWRIGGAESNKIGVNTGKEKLLTGTAPTATTLQLGFATGQTPRSKINVHEVVVYDRALTNEEYEKAVGVLNSRWNQEIAVVVEGDSVMAGAYSDSVADGIAADSAWSSVPIYDLATSSERTDEILAALEADVFGLVTAQTVILITNGGINDINQLVTSGTMTTNLASLFSQAKSNRFTMVGTANHEHGSWNASQDADNATVNAFVRASGNVDHVVPMDTLFPTPLDPAKFVDGVHPNQTGMDDIVDWILDNVLVNYE